jgi:hypothetical protein
MAPLPALAVSVSQTPLPQTLAIELNQAADVTAEDLSFWREVFEHVGRVVEHGGFSSRDADLSAAAFKMSELECTGTRVGAALRIGPVDVGFWRVLVQVLQAASEASIPLTRITIAAATHAAGTLNESAVMRLAYPQHEYPLPFEVERVPPPDPTKNRLVRIVFANPPDDVVRDACVAALLSWDNLLLGGYPEEGEDPLSNATDATEAYWTNGATLEHPLPNFIGSEAAFDVIVAMAFWLHQRDVFIASVLIE